MSRFRCAVALLQERVIGRGELLTTLLRERVIGRGGQLRSAPNSRIVIE